MLPVNHVAMIASAQAGPAITPVAKSNVNTIFFLMKRKRERPPIYLREKCVGFKTTVPASKHHRDGDRAGQLMAEVVAWVQEHDTASACTAPLGRKRCSVE